MLRLFSLLRIAAQAEGLRWRRTGRGLAIQAGLVAAAALFVLMLVLMLHAAAFAWLEPDQGAVGAALILAAVDLVLGGLLAWLAARRSEDPVAVEASRLRDDALRQVGDRVGRAAVVLPLLRSQSARKGLFGAALTAAMVGLIARR